MALPNSSIEVVIADTTNGLAKAPVPIDQELDDWNVYYQLLLAGKLGKYRGQFVVIHRGKVVAHGADPEQLRINFGKQPGVSEGRLVIPFVDDKECVVME
jgi:hypothetical protein